MNNQIAPSPMTLIDLQGHFTYCKCKTFFIYSSLFIISGSKQVEQ